MKYSIPYWDSVKWPACRCSHICVKPTVKSPNPRSTTMRIPFFSFIINKIIQDCVGNMDVFKMSDALGTSICCGSADNMFLNPTVDVLSAITHGSWNLPWENHILIYLNVFNHCLYAVRALQGSHDTIEMIYQSNILDFVDNNKHQIYTNFESVLFNTQVKVLRHNVHIFPFINVILALLLKHTKYLKGISR